MGDFCKQMDFCEYSYSESVAKKPFIVNYSAVDEDLGDAYCDEPEDGSNSFDSVCAICDNGGEILCCEGRCMRSFHAIKDTGTDSHCRTLGYSRAQVEAMKNFLCENCKHARHQCFACGRLGSSDKAAHAEVFLCVSARCGHYYHSKCVSQLLFRENEAEAIEFRKRIVDGESFTCPVHKCFICKKVENKEVKELQFAICRRCPKSYHRKCLPEEISFDDIEERGILRRAWDDLLPNRILIYCLDHKMDENLETPLRNHILFPEIPQKEKVNIKAVVKKWQISDDLHRGRSSLKPKVMMEKHSGMGNCGRTDTKQVVSKIKVKPSRENARSLKEMAEASVPPFSSSSTLKKFSSSFPVIDSESVARIKALMEKTSSSLAITDIIKKRMVPSTHAYIARYIERTITRARVEVTIEAVRTALLKLDKGSSIEDAKAVCEPDVLKEIHKWKRQLNVYLAPFLHGMRYTSFGRHFTKVDKLKEIVDKLQWYVQSGDTIVDFCCGANDFSKLMKGKLDEIGKVCSFKNYDIIQPKDDFCFERRDWMEVEPKELPKGSQLIMGLNPPFGVRAALANKFINKALTFRPKLLILIVPKETQRLDEKNLPYDLIWEDSEKLAGKSFYLPGSVDIDDQQMEQWNLTPPPLYLWSRSDWTKKHRRIAAECGHNRSNICTKSTGDPEVRPPKRRNVQRSEGASNKYRGANDSSAMSISPTHAAIWRQPTEGSEYGQSNYSTGGFPGYNSNIAHNCPALSSGPCSSRILYNYSTAGTDNIDCYAQEPYANNLHMYQPGPYTALPQGDLLQRNRHDAFGSQGGPSPSSLYGLPFPGPPVGTSGLWLDGTQHSTVEHGTSGMLPSGMPLQSRDGYPGAPGIKDFTPGSMDFPPGP